MSEPSRFPTSIRRCRACQTPVLVRANIALGRAEKKQVRGYNLALSGQLPGGEAIPRTRIPNAVSCPSTAAPASHPARPLCIFSGSPHTCQSNPLEVTHAGVDPLCLPGVLCLTAHMSTKYRAHRDYLCSPQCFLTLAKVERE